jgi:hypothetical protein
MQLTQGNDCEGEYPIADRVAARERLMRNGLRELLDELRPPTRTANNADLQLQWPMYYDRNPRNWLTALALVLTPRLESLLLAIDHLASFDSSRGRPSLHFQFPRLRTLGLMGYRSDYGFGELAELFAAAPNLETIYACESAGWSMDGARGNHTGNLYELKLPNLQKLAIADAIPEDLGLLLERLPKLEIIEYYWKGHPRGENDRLWIYWDEFLEPASPAAKTVKRLCLSYIPYNQYPHAYIEVSPIDYFPLTTLRHFERLEELMLHCRSIYEKGERDDSDRLVSLLPPSIRSFRIAYVFMGLKRSLTGLVLEAPRRFPDLKRVEIGIAQGIRPEHKDGIEQTKTVDTLFAAAGIELV